VSPRQRESDYKEHHIYPAYWQPDDTTGICRIEGEDVWGFPNVRHAEDLTAFSADTFSD